ncbi:MAG: hypothetical protein ACRDPM_21465, partial [Solirubrobacteraceae bacterium]
MRRLRMVSVVLVGVLAAVVIVGAVAANGHARHVRRAHEHPAKVTHAGSAVRGGHVIVVLKQANRGARLPRSLARRAAIYSAQQAPIVSTIKRSGGNHIRQLKLVNAVAANVSAKEARHLATMGNVAQVIPDQQVTETVPLTPAATNVTPGPGECTKNPNKPMLEPEALQTMHFAGRGTDEADRIADGAGVVVAIDGMNELAGNPNFTRPDGTHVVEDAPDYNPNDIPNDPALDEWFGDASSVAAQGTVTYQYSSELPFSNFPAGCTFVIKGDAPVATLADLSLVDPATTVSIQNGVRVATVSQSESSIIAGMDNAVTTLHADVISESYGSGGGSNLLWAADDAAVASGITVVAS